MPTSAQDRTDRSHPGQPQKGKNQELASCMTNVFDHSDEESGLNSEDLKFFKKRAKFLSLSTFAGTDLSSGETGAAAAAKKTGKKDKKRPGDFDALEAAEDAQATAFKKMQSSLQNKGDTDNEDGSGGESEEDEFDRRAKKIQTKRSTVVSEEKTGALPVRTVSGEWHRKATVLKPSTAAVVIATEEEEESNDLEVKDTAKPVVVAMTFEEAKERMALLAMEITENIDDNFGKLKELLKFTRNGVLRRENSTRDEECELMRMGLITAVAVFKDILPEYSIRPLTEVEQQAKVGKEVRKQRNLEEGLLRSYGQYVDRLEEILKTVKRGDAGVVPIGVACLSELAVCAGHFNYYERVLAALCGQVFNGREAVHSVAISGLGKVFSEDEVGRSTGHALRLLSDAIQSRDYSPPVHVIEVLQHVRARVLAYSRSDALPSDKRIASEEVARLDVYKKKSVHLSKTQKKTLKAELVESIKSAHAEAEYSREERSKWSSDALKFLFRILFGILKRFTNNSADNKTSDIVTLLPEVMKCLCKCAQFLSVEYFSDLLSTLKKTIGLVEKEQSMLASLHTIQTVLQISSLQETSRVNLMKSSSSSAAVIDMKFYFDLIYRQLGSVASVKSDSTPSLTLTWSPEFENLFESVISKLFLSKKHCPTVRIAAFIHRFVNLINNESSSSLPLDGKIYFFKLILRFFDHHQATRGLLESETLGVAAYLPTCPDPDLCNPFCKQVDLESILKTLKPKPIPKSHEKVFNQLSAQVKKLLLSLQQ